ncbi:Uncharacterised protein [Bordetella pertussis]|nr:Uncharacterised protein [Bordetella pertussis]CPM47385.1 Uncharacterised protein [Bordetella pertussis]CPO15146.1 Uncharacterised protein [Bordetella pertussis]
MMARSSSSRSSCWYIVMPASISGTSWIFG